MNKKKETSALDKKEFYKMLKDGSFANMVKETMVGETVNNSGDIYNILKPMTEDTPDRESFICVFLNAKNKIIAIETMFKGTLTAAPVFPREIVKRGLELGAAALIVAHNHPSGEITLSPEDLSITKQIFAACAFLGITLHEHLVMGGSGKFTSMADSGAIASISSWLKSITK